MPKNTKKSFFERTEALERAIRFLRNHVNTIKQDEMRFVELECGADIKSEAIKSFGKRFVSVSYNFEFDPECSALNNPVITINVLFDKRAYLTDDNLIQTISDVINSRLGSNNCFVVINYVECDGDTNDK